jgi:hypothetical protein
MSSSAREPAGCAGVGPGPSEERLPKRCARALSVVPLVALLLGGEPVAAAAPPVRTTTARAAKRISQGMLRWQVRFATDNAPEYLAQLRGLGAILAIPVGKGWKVVRDLRPPAKLLNEDISKLKRIYWIDSNPRSVADLLAALGVRVKATRLVALMPRALEKKLFELEKKEMLKRRGKFNAEEIKETVFRMVQRGRRYELEVVKITFKRPRQ